MDTHTHTRNYYRKFSETTTTTGTLEPKGITTIPSDTCAVPVPISADCDSGTRVEPAPVQQARTVALFVSTSLDTWTTDHAVAFNRDVQLNDTAFRRLDPEYYAWLRSRMNMAKLAVLAGQLTQEAFDGLRDRFNQIHEWAMAHLGEAALQEAVRILDARDYQPPTAEPWDGHEAPAATTESHIHAEELAMVDAIREQAMNLGWRHERLYATGRRLAPFRGLASYLNPGDRLGAVTRNAIEIILRSGVRQHFYNPDVEQPWIRRVAKPQ